MAYCPVCQHERDAGAKKCPICDGKLVGELPDPDFSDTEVAAVAIYPRSSEAQQARRKLAVYGIESAVGPAAAKSGIRVMVRKEEAGWAGRVLAVE